MTGSHRRHNPYQSKRDHDTSSSNGNDDIELTEFHYKRASLHERLLDAEDTISMSSEDSNIKKESTVKSIWRRVSQPIWPQGKWLPFSGPTIRSMFLTIVIIPFSCCGLGRILDNYCGAPGTRVNTVMALLAALLAAPFTLIFAHWRRSVFNQRVASTSRITWDIFMSIVTLISFMTFAQYLPTSFSSSAYMYASIEDMLAGYETVVDSDSFWTYMKDNVGKQMYPEVSLCPEDTFLTDFFRYAYPGRQNWFATDSTSACGCSNELTSNLWYFGLLKFTTSITVRQVRVNKKPYPSFYGYKMGDYLDLYPEFNVDNEQKGPWGPGVKLTEIYGDQLEYLKYGQHAVVTTINNSNCTFFPSPDQYLDMSGFENLTWGETSAQSAWFYKSDLMLNIAGNTVVPPLGQGPTKSTAFPSSGYIWQLPTAAWGFQQGGVASAADYLKREGWVDGGTRLLVLSASIVDVVNSKWAYTTIQFEVTSSGKIYPDFNIAIGDMSVSLSESEYEGDLQSKSTTKFPDIAVELYLMLVSIQIYYFSTTAVRWHERVSLYNVFAYDMALMDILTQLVALFSFIVYEISLYYWPDISCAQCKEELASNFMGESTFSAPAAYLWQYSRDIFGIAIILQWLHFTEYLALIPTVGVVPRAMLNSMRTVGLFLITLIIVLAAFTSGFVTIYSSSTPVFNSHTTAAITLWSALLGNIDAEEFIKTRYYVGIVLFFTFSFFTLFVFLTMLIAVITEGYEKAKSQVAEFEESHKSIKKASYKQQAEAYFEYFATIHGRQSP